MIKKIKLTRYRNIKLQRRNAGDVLVVGGDITLGQAQTLMRVGAAVEVTDKKKKKAE